MHPAFRLVRLSPSPGPSEWPLPTESTIRIGRGVQNGEAGTRIELSPDWTVSRQHAELWWHDGCWWIRDLGSRHGTRLDRRELVTGEPTRCRPGVEIGIGTALFAVVGSDWHRLRCGPLACEFRLSARYGASFDAANLPLLHGLTLANWGHGTVSGGLELRLGELAQTLVDVPVLHPGDRRRLPGSALTPERAILLRTTDSQQLELGARLDDLAYDGPSPRCLVLAHDSWSYLPEHRFTLAAFVQTDHSRIVDLARRALRGVAQDCSAAAVLESIYATLADAWHIDYRKDVPQVPDGVQKIRLVHQVLWDPRHHTGEGTCLDLALVIAACLEAARRPPLIALVDMGNAWHALAGCWVQPHGTLEMSPAEREDLLGGAVWVDPNGCTRDVTQRLAFGAARERAMTLLAQRPLVYALDIVAARRSGIRALPHS